MNYKDTLMYKEIYESISTLPNIINTNKQTMQKLINDIKNKNIQNVTTAARGTSDHALIYFKYLLEIFTPIKVGLAACSVITAYEGKINYKDNLVIGVSQSGKAADVLSVLERANKDGAITVAITNNLSSPMAKTAKYHLYCDCNKEKSVAATKTFTSQLYILCWLVGEISNSTYILDNLKKVHQLMKSNIDMIEDASTKIANELKNTIDGFVLARGIMYALSLEAALKLQETSYLKMKGYPYSDFQHGPMAMVSDDIPIIIFAPTISFVNEQLEEARKKELREIIEKMESLNGKVFIITDNDNFNKYKNVYKISKEEIGEPFAVFIYALFIQLTACKLSTSKGINPDSPRALKKVTVTK